MANVGKMMTLRRCRTDQRARKIGLEIGELCLPWTPLGFQIVSLEQKLWKFWEDGVPLERGEKKPSCRGNFI